MKIDEIRIYLNDCDIDRTVSAITGLSPETEVEFVEKQCAWAGTGYKTLIYRVKNTDDAITVYHNCDITNVTLRRGFFNERRIYGRQCHQASKRTGLPMPVCLALSPELCDEFALATNGLKISEEIKEELSCGIKRRKVAIFTVIGPVSYQLKAKLDKMGQVNSSRIANYLINLK